MRRLVIVALLALLVPASARAWSWPVDGPVLRPFSLGSNPYVGGQHRGIANFTIGQRRGLGITGATASYVVDLDPESDTVTIGPLEDLDRRRLVATDVNFIAGERPREPLRVEAKIRHRHVPARATLRMLDAATAEVVFDEPQRAITPGQSVVWYEGELVIGGGVIARAR